MVSAFLTFLAAVAYLWVVSHGTQQVASRPGAWRNCFNGILVGLSDQALVTALSITIAALSFGKTMATYHFRLAMDLGSLAIGVHVLSILVPYIRYRDEYNDTGVLRNPENQPSHQGRRVRIALLLWRRLCMLATAILISIMLHWTDFNLPPKCPVKCAGKFTNPLTRWQAFRKNIVKLILTEACSLFFFVDLPRLVPVKKSWQLQYPTISSMLRYSRISCFSLYLLAAFGFYCSAATLLIHDYVEGRSYMGKGEQHLENAMGFGQLVPIILLMLPFMAAGTAYHGKFCACPAPWLINADTR